MTASVYDILAEAQATIAVPKGRNNDFGGYKYRKAEDIIHAFRKGAPKGALLRVSDRIEEIGGQIFVIATASLTYAGETVSSESGAMHPLQKKGMDASQITGSASSYARKYALQGLFALDDGESDPDSRDNRQENGQQPPQATEEDIEQAVSLINDADTVDNMTQAWKALPAHVGKAPAVIEAAKARKAELTQNKEAA